MTAEQHSRHPILPEWAAQERDRDLAWIGENILAFWPLATGKFSELGRGVVAVNTAVRIEGDSHPVGYIPADMIAELDDLDTTRMVGAYDPEHEFVVFLIKPGARTSTYRVRPAPGSLAILQ